MVFQGSALFDSMTVLENVMFPLVMLTENRDEIIDIAQNVIRELSLKMHFQNFLLNSQAECKKELPLPEL